MVLLFMAQAALADLYRWIDPETGSVKLSSYPPPWLGDPEQEKRAPKVELIPSVATPPAAAAVAPRPEPKADAKPKPAPAK